MCSISGCTGCSAPNQLDGCFEQEGYGALQGFRGCSSMLAVPIGTLEDEERTCKARSKPSILCGACLPVQHALAPVLRHGKQQRASGGCRLVWPSTVPQEQGSFFPPSRAIPYGHELRNSIFFWWDPHRVRTSSSSWIVEIFCSAHKREAGSALSEIPTPPRIFPLKGGSRVRIHLLKVRAQIEFGKFNFASDFYHFRFCALR